MPRWDDWAWQALPFRDLPPGWQQWLLARRSISQPDEIAYYFAFAPVTVTLEEVIRAAGTRWQVEAGFELSKQGAGLVGLATTASGARQAPHIKCRAARFQ